MMQVEQSYNEIELSVAEVAGLVGCSERYIQSQVKDGTIFAMKRLNNRNRPVYCIPLSSLDTKVQDRYYRRDTKTNVSQFPAKAKPLDCYSEEERAQIHFWTSLLEEWQLFREEPTHASKAEADEKFAVYAEVAYLKAHLAIFTIPLQLSVRTLYRRYTALKNDDLDGLIEKRGKAQKGASTMEDIVWDAFLYYYLDQSEHPISQCHYYTQLWVQEMRPELLESIPSYSTFYRRVQNDLPEPLKVLGRKGHKAYQDRCAPYITRVYDEMESNDYWVADTHTFDIMSANDDGKAHRMYLTAFFDARSGIFTGSVVTNNPGSQAVLNALRKGIFKYGIPRNIYVDNGREFLTYDVGGLGHRKKKKKVETYEPPAVFQRLGITMVNAKVRNARAKTIERAFLNVKNQLSRLFPTFTGGNVLEKPERLKEVLKKGDIPSDVQLIRKVEKILEWHFNFQPYSGAVMSDHGKTRLKVFHEHLHTKRVASEDDLNLMLMRSSRPQKVGRKGIYHKVGLLKIDYWNELMVSTMFGDRVYYRFDPENLSIIRVYDLKDRFLMTLEADNITVQKYGCSQEELKAASKIIHNVEKNQKQALKDSGLAVYDRISALDLVLAQARRNEMEFVAPQAGAKILELNQVTEQPLLQKVSGSDYDIDTMLANAERRYEEGFIDE